jgi:cytoskeleton protein RodZ
MSVGIGDALREARQQAGVPLADAAAETRIRESNLLALEQEHFAPIGGDVYVKGFIRSYARYLGMDPEPLVHAYQAHYEVGSDRVNVAKEPVESLPPPRRPITTIVVVLALLTIGGLAALGFMAPAGVDPADEPSSPDPVVTAPPDEEDGDEPGDVAGADDDARAGEGEPGTDDADDADGSDGADGAGEDEADDDGPDPSEELVITLSVPDGSSWARITVDGEQVDEATFQSGYSETYVGEEILVRVGDAANVSLEINGRDMGRIGDSGAVVEVRCSTDAADCEIG